MPHSSIALAQIVGARNLGIDSEDLPSSSANVNAVGNGTSRAKYH
jgi:hypothetical protein